MVGTEFLKLGILGSRIPDMFLKNTPKTRTFWDKIDKY